MVEVHDLPPEILATIFTGVFEQDNRRSSASFRLAHVSQRWRIVALENAALWAHISFQLIKHNSEAQIILASYLLHLSKQHPLVIRMDCRGPPDYDIPIRTITKIAACIKPHEHRWQSFVATFPSTKLAKVVISSLFTKTWETPSQLHYLRLSMSPEPSAALVPFGFQPLIVDFPEPLRGSFFPESSIKTLRCFNFDPLHCIGDVTSLRQLDIYISEPDIVLDYRTFHNALKFMTNVERLSIVGVTFRMTQEAQDFGAVTLSSVISFSYTITRNKPGMLQSWVPLCSIDTPNIRELNLGAAFDLLTQDDPLGSTVQSYLFSPARVPLFPHLISLWISGPIVMEDIIPFSSLFPRLEALMVGIGADGTNCVEQICNNNFSEASISTECIAQPNQIALPRLRTLGLYECDVKSLVSLVQQRIATGVPFREVLIGPIEESDDVWIEELTQLIRVDSFPKTDPLYTPDVDKRWSVDELGYESA